MNFDLISMAAIAVTVSAVLLTFATAFGRNLREQATIAGVLAAWFAAVIAYGASGAQAGGVAGLGIAVVLPLALLCGLAFGSQAGRRRMAEAPLVPLIAVQTLRVLGVLFLFLYGWNRLPAPFAPQAGWGDVLVGMLAAPVALTVYRSQRSVKPPVIGWSLLGMADLATALTLGPLSSLPWILIPGFLVPCFLFLHIVVLWRTVRAPGLQQSAANPAWA